MFAPYFFWMALACATIIFELGHPGLFFFLSLSFGSVVAAITSIYSYQLSMQMAFFLIGTLIAVMICRLWLKYTERSTVRTNMNALLGKSAIVIANISFDSPGYVKVEGEKWLARSGHKKKLVTGAQVRIVDVRGAHVVVEALQSSEIFQR